MAETDLSTWLTVEQAAAAIGVSTRTVERLGRAGKLDQRLRPQAGSPPVAVYFPDDVDRERVQRHPAPPPFVLTREADSPTNGNGKGQGLTYPNRSAGVDSDKLAVVGDDPIRQLCALVLHALQSPPSPPVAESVAETLSPAEHDAQYVTLQEAAAIKRVSERLLLRWIRSGALPAEREPRSVWTTADRGWRIQRKELRAL